MLTNLKASYLRDGDFVRAVRIIERLRQLNPDDAMQQRDLGPILLQARPSRDEAIDHLEAYLHVAPPGEDAEAVRKLLGQARGMLARWN